MTAGIRLRTLSCASAMRKRSSSSFLRLVARRDASCQAQTLPVTRSGERSDGHRHPEHLTQLRASDEVLVTGIGRKLDAQPSRATPGIERMRKLGHAKSRRFEPCAQGRQRVRHDHDVCIERVNRLDMTVHRESADEAPRSRSRAGWRQRPAKSLAPPCVTDSKASVAVIRCRGKVRGSARFAQWHGYKSWGRSPVCLAMRASIRGPISSPS